MPSCFVVHDIDGQDNFAMCGNGSHKIQHQFCYTCYTLSCCSSSISSFVWSMYPLIARFMGPTWGPSGADRTQVGPMLAPWNLLSGSIYFRVAALEWVKSSDWPDATEVMLKDMATIHQYQPTTNHNKALSVCVCWDIPDSKVHGAKMGPIWGRQVPGGPHVGPMNFAIRDVLSLVAWPQTNLWELIISPSWSKLGSWWGNPDIPLLRKEWNW